MMMYSDLSAAEAEAAFLSITVLLVANTAPLGGPGGAGGLRTASAIGGAAPVARARTTLLSHMS
eukprot:CAMPEP_0198346490 /NCGR_PEP_ID=MMETSP1450-20131203/79962_1 /TAXON_ID=753684 ORGANISM="Madagascaria erythrocladiodes, Strain CCMP3234" /NCGR_SAMPLE_ID=MMETSP1450 /ASSEMBLY_ACC=CAM_ASM_001115 /LENGTH=63 /DNA_ID=CAMNT_0044051931 /DNA_START=98 /DNA_END=285 /DNA_ORIENTATION=+